MTSALLLLGASYRTTTFDTLGGLADDAQSFEMCLREAVSTTLLPGCQALGVLRTCNRVEIFALSHAATARLTAERIRLHVFGRTTAYRLFGSAALRHLCRVAVGLDSAVLGEHEIAAQVSEAIGRALVLTESDEHLRRVGRVVRAAVKRIRTETGLARHTVSVPSVAVHLVLDALPNLCTCHAVLVGAGRAASRLGRVLEKAGVGRLTIVNRCPVRAGELANQLGATAAPLTELSSAVGEADVVLTATSAGRILVSACAVKKRIEQQPARPLLMVDVSLPSNIDPVVRHFSGVSLLTLAHVRERLARHQQLRLAEAPAAEAIICDVVERSWLHGKQRIAG